MNRSVFGAAWVLVLAGLLGCSASQTNQTQTGADGGALAACQSLCDGCCDEAGRCHGGGSAESCGAGGKLCAACGTSEQCVKGACEVYDCRAQAGACGTGTVCDSSSGLCATTCTGTTDCHRTGETCASGACTCAAGTHACGAQCASTTSVQSCGTSCTACPAPEHATATCDGQRCGFTCAAPYIACGSGCCQATGSLGAGERHSCLLTSLGGAKCWGDNTFGQLGDGTVANRTRPVDVQGLSGAVSLSLGAYHSCVLLDDAGVTCWGRNSFGELGDGTLADRNVPTPVQGLPAAQSVSAGAWHTCAVTTQGKITCWGDNGHHQLGDSGGRSVPLGASVSKVPTEINDPTERFTSVASGGLNSCALTTSNSLTCWGDDSRALVTPYCNGASVPYDCWATGSDLTSGPHAHASLTSDVLAVSVGASTACVLVSSGAAKCWGLLPAGYAGDSNSPITMTGLTTAAGPTVSAVGAGLAGGGCALNSGGQVFCWDNSHVPTMPYGLDGGVIGLATANNHSCAAMADAGVKCWGLNDVGQLGDGTTQPRTVPVDVAFEAPRAGP